MAGASGWRWRPAFYGLVHALVDAACVTAVVRASHVHYVGDLGLFWTAASYDLLAFGLQLPLGLLFDRLAKPRLAMILGVLMAASVLTPGLNPSLATVLTAGIGNALFHLGAGSLVLQGAEGRAGPAGVFVGPGALGLGLGIWMGRTGRGSTFPIYVALAFAAMVLLFLDRPKLPGQDQGAPREPAPQLRLGAVWVLVMFLLLVSTGIRSFVGTGGCYLCPAGLALVIGGPVAGCLGKLLGGVVADRVGWLLSSVLALVLALPLIAFSGGALWLALPGALLAQSTMAVTLSAVYRLMPRWPGTAFGLPCLALVGGSFLGFFPAGKAFFGAWTFVVLIAVSTVALAVGLRKLGWLEMQSENVCATLGNTGRQPASNRGT